MASTDRSEVASSYGVRSSRLTSAPVFCTGIQVEENKVKKSIKEAAKKGQTDVAKILAKELIQSRKAVGKLYASKAHMNSVVMTMQQQLCKGYSLLYASIQCPSLTLQQH